ncbi:MAG: TonB-dependent receptor, partial [Candidatus Binatia bacterium]
MLLAALAVVVLRTPAAGQESELDSRLSDSAPEAGSGGAEAGETGAAAAAPAGTEPAAVEPAQASSRRLIEEIIVTAQKRQQAAIDVPLSLSVIDDEFISQQGITDLQQLSVYVPNANIRLNPVFPDVRIRGFGTGVTNKAFEQSAGLAIDQIPYTRLSYFRGGLYDLERVEVLRGPQGTLYGKNTVAGLFNMIPKDPTDEYTGNLDLQLGELDRRRVEAAVGGPLVEDFLNFRVAGLLYERQGFVRNTTAAVAPAALDRLQGLESNGARVRLAFPNLLGSSLKLSYDRFDIDATGVGAEFKIVPQNTRPLFLRYDPNTDFEPDNYVASVDHPDGSRTKANTIAANWSYDVGEWGIDAVAGHSVLESIVDFDTDYSPAPAGVITSGDDNLQTTGELRLTSPPLSGLLGLGRLFGFDLGTSDLIAGVFYQQRLIRDSFLTLEVDPILLAEAVALQNGPALPVPPPPAEGGIVREASTLRFNQTADAIAGFGQMNWSFLPKWTWQLGLRLQEETKQADWMRTYDTPTAVTFQQVLMWQEFTAEREKSEFQVSPKVSLNYKPTDDVSLFARWSRGFKGGGFNEFATGPSDDELLFDQEKVDEWAIDAKTTLLDGAARLNISLFRMDLDDFQVLTSPPGALTITVINAAKARAQGIESDLTWYPAEWLTIVGTLGLNDSEFLDFKTGTCSQDRENTDGDDDPRCDHTGQPLVRTPKWVSSWTTITTLPLSVVPGLRNLSTSLLGGLGLAHSFT